MPDYYGLPEADQRPSVSDQQQKGANLEICLSGHDRLNRSILTAPRRAVGQARRDLPPRFFLRSAMTETIYSTKRLNGIPLRGPLSTSTED